MIEKNLMTKQDVLPAASKSQRAASDDIVNLAGLMVGSLFPATYVVNAYSDAAADPGDILMALRSQAAAIQQGDMTQLEAMLINQAVALQSMFSNLAVRASKQKTLEGVQCLSQLALRSQAGCRATLQTLAEVKYPRQVAFVKQTNVAHTQQVNNGVPSPSSSHTETIVGEPNELLVETPHGSKKMDRRTKEKAGRADPAVVTMD